MYQLPKQEKKIAKACIDKGLDAEFREGMEIFEAIIRDWRNEKFASRDAYHELYEAVANKDRAIARRYNGLNGSRWLVTVVYILHDGYISEDDIKDFSDETKTVIKRMLTDSRSRAH